MPTVRFAWSPMLVEVRRQACPKARWLAGQRAWMMDAVEVRAFIATCHARLEFSRTQAELIVDGER